jgi:ABC-type dipeptide/oligopeptide/nickel transport system permease subunit
MGSLRRIPIKIYLFLIPVVIMIASSIFAPYIAPCDPIKINLSNRLKPPVWSKGGEFPYMLGTDHLGRDVLSRIIYGSRISLIVGLASSLMGASFGVSMGIISGYFRGKIDATITKIIDIQLSFPFLLFAITVIAVLGPSLKNLLIVLAISGWVTYARIIRGQTLSLREKDFIESSRAVGCNNLRIIIGHIFPNIISYVLIIMTIEIGRIIVLESSLSFIGLGIQPPTPSWGNALSDGKDYLITAWWLATFPGIAIMTVVLSLNVLGDSARDLLEPLTRSYSLNPKVGSEET